MPPIERTSSALAGRTSYADTTAPSRLAVAIACSPATPAPSTSTRAGGTVPAAVMNSGKKRGSRVAASSTQRYPATSACEVSASIDCARLIRGTSSMAKRRHLGLREGADDVELGGRRAEAEGHGARLELGDDVGAQRADVQEDVDAGGVHRLDDVRARGGVGGVRGEGMRSRPGTGPRPRGPRAPGRAPRPAAAPPAARRASSRRGPRPSSARSSRRRGASGHATSLPLTRLVVVRQSCTRMGPQGRNVSSPAAVLP